MILLRIICALPLDARPIKKKKSKSKMSKTKKKKKKGERPIT